MQVNSSFSLEGKCILITGAASGIGRATAKECAINGASLVLVDLNGEGLEATLSEINSSSLNEKKHQCLVADLSNDEGINSLVEALPMLDGAVFCAGIGITKTVPFYKRSDFQRIFDINFLAPVLTTKLMVKKKLVRKGASLVYMVSIGGVYSINPGNGIYGASKSALHSFVKFAALELASKGIRCNGVCPARVETPLIKQVPISEEEVEKDKKRYALRRYAQPQEVAQGCVFLLSDASSYMTGQDLILDGGRLLH